MSNKLRKLKRTPKGLAQKESESQIKRMRRFAAKNIYLKNSLMPEKVAQPITFDVSPSKTVIISEWCDDGANKPKCGDCPICLHITTGDKRIELTVRSQDNPNDFKTINLAHNEN